MIYSFVVSFILGIAFEQVFNFGWSLSLLSVVVFFFIFLILRSENSRLWFLCSIFFAVGILRMNFVDTSPDENLSKMVGEKISFEATISEEPDVRDGSARYTVKPSSSKSFVLLVSDRFPEFKYGDKISVSGKLDLPKNFSSDTGLEFDYISYLAKDKIHFLIYRPEIDPTSSSSTGLRGTSKIISFLYSVKKSFIEKIGNVVPEPNSSLLAGVIFGAKQSLGQGLLDDFKKVGLIHIVVLSGYNITIIAVGVFFLMSYFGKRNLSFLLSIIFISLFAIMVGLSATVIRACIMAFIAILAKFLGRPADALRWLFIAGFLMLIWNPLILFYDPSFQLSFAATLGLILFSQYILSFISKHKIAKFIPTKFGIREIVASTLAVQIFVLPLLIKMSGFISLISFLINPIILPLIPWLMAFGAITGALGNIPFIGTMLSWPFGVLSYFLAQITISLTEFSARIPFATLQTGSISLFVIFVWYLFYGFIYWKLKKVSPPTPSYFKRGEKEKLTNVL
ncbi:MAG: ComEC/Rec2 family competence protein [Patescibacteria group bacterium]